MHCPAIIFRLAPALDKNAIPVAAAIFDTVPRRPKDPTRAWPVCMVPKARLAEQTGLSKSQVTRALTSLRAAGVLLDEEIVTDSGTLHRQRLLVLPPPAVKANEEGEGSGAGFRETTAATVAEWPWRVAQVDGRWVEISSVTPTSNAHPLAPGCEGGSHPGAKALGTRVRRGFAPGCEEEPQRNLTQPEKNSSSAQVIALKPDRHHSEEDGKVPEGKAKITLEGAHQRVRDIHALTIAIMVDGGAMTRDDVTDLFEEISKLDAAVRDLDEGTWGHCADRIEAGLTWHAKEATPIEREGYFVRIIEREAPKAGCGSPTVAKPKGKSPKRSEPAEPVDIEVHRSKTPEWVKRQEDELLAKGNRLLAQERRRANGEASSPTIDTSEHPSTAPTLAAAQ